MTESPLAPDIAPAPPAGASPVVYIVPPELQPPQPALSPRKRRMLENSDRMAPQRRKWISRNSSYYADDRRYMRFLVRRKANVLALGCGIGDMLADLEPAKAIGVDLSPGMIEEARKLHPGLTFVAGDPEADATIDALQGPLDYIVLIDTVGQLDDIEGALTKLHKLCNHETRLIIAYYSPGWEPLIKLATKLGRRMPQPQPNLVSTTDFLNILDLAEFEPVRTEWRQLVPLKLLGLGRLINRFIAPLPGIRRLALRNYVVARSKRAAPPENPSTTIVIPCRNEKGNIERAILEMPRFGRHQEIIFVEGNSKDGTYDECLRVQAAYAGVWDIKVMKQDGKGKGDAVRKGFAAATGDILMILDADLTVPPEAMPKFYNAMATGKGEFINGTRLVYPMENEAMKFLNHYANRTFAALFSYMLNQRFTDTLCGTKVLWRRDYERIVANRSYFGEFDPFGDFDLIFGAAKSCLKIVEVPVHYKARVYGETQISRFRDGWLLLRMVLFAFKKLKAV
jgi:SAM-dependent methyltransferase